MTADSKMPFTKSKRHQKLYEHYLAHFKEEPVLSLRLRRNVLPTDMKPITTLVFIKLGFIEQTGHGVSTIVDKYGKKAFTFLGDFLRVRIPLATSWANASSQWKIPMARGVAISMYN